MDLEGILFFEEPPHSIPFINQSGQRFGEPFHYIALRDLIQTNPRCPG
jgi:hypothetical protein